MDDAENRAAAAKRLHQKRDFFGNVVAFVIVNLMLTAIWALSGGGYFWPVWTIFGWGIGLAFHAWSVFGERPITEDAIQREMQRMEQTGSYPAPEDDTKD